MLSYLVYKKKSFTSAIAIPVHSTPFYIVLILLSRIKGSSRIYDMARL